MERNKGTGECSVTYYSWLKDNLEGSARMKWVRYYIDRWDDEMHDTNSRARNLVSTLSGSAYDEVYENYIKSTQKTVDWCRDQRDKYFAIQSKWRSGEFSTWHTETDWGWGTELTWMLLDQPRFQVLAKEWGLGEISVLTVNTLDIESLDDLYSVLELLSEDTEARTQIVLADSRAYVSIHLPLEGGNSISVTRRRRLQLDGTYGASMASCIARTLLTFLNLAWEQLPT